jgi:hypothetical protein
VALPIRRVKLILKPMKYCHKCQQDKADHEFYFDPRRNKLSSPCKPCRRAIVKSYGNRWKLSNPDKCKKSDQKAKMKSKYGLSLDGLIDLWELQNRACAICKHPISLNAKEKASKPHVDHCHTTGKVRGLLCLTCNTGLGMFGDSSDLIGAAREYLLCRQDASASISDTAPVSADQNATNSTIH